MHCQNTDGLPDTFLVDHGFFGVITPASVIVYFYTACAVDSNIYVAVSST